MASSLIVVLALLGGVASARADCRPSSLGPDVPVALVLSGGGAKGAWEAGVALALLERGAPVRIVAGSSAGALTAAMITDGRLGRLAEVWRSLTTEQVYAIRPSVLFGGLLPGWLSFLALDHAGSFLDASPLRDLVTSVLDVERIRASPVHLLVVAADPARREQRRLDNRTVTADALVAATAVPGVFAPVEVDGALLVDGGLVGRAPVLEALESGVPVARAIVVMSYSAGERGQAPTTVRRVLEGVFEMAMTHQIRRDVELARLKYPAVEIQVVQPSAPLDLRPLDFDPPRLAAALERGRSDGRACVEAWGGARSGPAAP